MNGRIALLTRNKKKFSDKEWKEIGFHFVWNISMFKKFDGFDIMYMIRPILNRKIYEREYKVVVVDEENKIKDMIDGNLFSADAMKWNYNPINTDEIPNIFDNLKQFETMENSERRSDIKEEGEK